MKETILIIDDDIDLRQSLKVGLEKEGFAVITAESADFGREIIKRVTADAIILDRMMPKTDGLTFMKELRETGEKIPILILTAMTGSENTIDGLSGGADDYLAKPFHLKELILRIKNILKKTDTPKTKMPPDLSIVDGEFFIEKHLLALSELEKKALTQMLDGEIVQIAPMVAKRLRTKLLANTKNIDIITVRGKGYKLVSQTK